MIEMKFLVYCENKRYNDINLELEEKEIISTLLFNDFKVIEIEPVCLTKKINLKENASYETNASYEKNTSYETNASYEKNTSYETTIYPKYLQKYPLYYSQNIKGANLKRQFELGWLVKAIPEKYLEIKFNNGLGLLIKNEFDSIFISKLNKHF